MASENLIRRYYPDTADRLIESSQAGAHLKDFSDLPLFNVLSSSVATDCLLSEGLNPNFRITSNYPQFFQPFYYENIAASIITRTIYLSIRRFLPVNIRVFPLITNEKFVINDISFTKHRRKYLSQYGQYFLKITEAYFRELDEDEKRVWIWWCSLFFSFSSNRSMRLIRSSWLVRDEYRNWTDIIQRFGYLIRGMRTTERKLSESSIKPTLTQASSTKGSGGYEKSRIPFHQRIRHYILVFLSGFEPLAFRLGAHFGDSCKGIQMFSYVRECLDFTCFYVL